MFIQNTCSNYSTIRFQSIVSLQEIEKSLYKPPRSQWIESAVKEGLAENLAIKCYDSYFGGAS